MADANMYEVVWPSGKRVDSGNRLAKRLDTLEGKVVCQLWDRLFKGDVMLDVWEEELTKRYPGIKFVSWREFGEIYGAEEKEGLASLPGLLKKFNCDAVICGVGC